jgi:hypothetical protein
MMIEEENTNPSPASIFIAIKLIKELKNSNYTEIYFNRNTKKYILYSRDVRSCKIYKLKTHEFIIIGLQSKKVYSSDVDFTDFSCIYSLDYD